MTKQRKKQDEVKRIPFWKQSFTAFIGLLLLLGIISFTFNNKKEKKQTKIEIGSKTALYYFENPQELIKIWDTISPYPKASYNETEIEAQKEINEKTDDGIMTYSPLGMEKEWERVDFDEITPFTWKWVDLELTNEDEGISNIHLRRPHWWMKELNADKIGNKVYLDMPEMAILGYATVKNIRINQLDSRFWNENRQGDYVSRPITGKFEHESSDIYYLLFDNNTKPLGVTGSHPIWSIDKNDWKEAKELKIGEKVKTHAGLAVLKSRTKSDRKQKVYNFEIYKDHNFSVSTDKILVHNNCLPDTRWIKHEVWNDLKGLGLQNKFKAAMDKGLATTRRGSSGIIKFTEQEMKQYPGYTYKLKIDGKGAAHYRILGNIGNNSKGRPIMTFSKIVSD